MTNSNFQDQPPQSQTVTGYDRAHFVHYLRLLDADAERADWGEAVQIVFGIDPAQEPDRAKMVYDSHLERAQWMTRSGYRHLLESVQ